MNYSDSIQIKDVPDRKNKFLKIHYSIVFYFIKQRYKFEELDDEEGDFDTRDDFLDGLRKDYN